MLSYQDIYTQAQDLVQDYSTDALTFLKRNVNIGQQILETELGSYYTEETYDVTTKASTGTYDTPADLVKVKHAYLTVDTAQYNLTQVYDEDKWQEMKATMVGVYNDAPTHIFVRRDSFEIFPGSETAAYTLTLRYEAGGKQLQYADYTTGTVTTLTSGATTVTVSGSTFTTAMAGRYFKVDADGVWYKIASYTSATVIELDRKYQGLSIAAGTSAYTIGEMPRTPSSTHHIPALYSGMNYFQGFKQDSTKGKYFRALYYADLKMAKTTYHDRYASNFIAGKYGRQSIANPNYPPPEMT